MKNTYNVGDWIHTHMDTTARVKKIEEVDMWGCGVRWENTEHTNGQSYINSIRLATNQEIINAGGTPKEIELNYEIY
tara:strand:+ start:893 stop:1123 length:231 start_codon:yes stop_codon:yes gene_type:complete